MARSGTSIMGQALGLSKLYFSNTLALGAFIERARGNWKKMAGAIATALLILFSVVNISLVTTLAIGEQYSTMAAMGLESLLLVRILAQGFLVTLVFGMLTVVSTYYTSQSEVQLLALPLDPLAFFTAKYLFVTVLQMALTTLFMGAPLIALGIASSAGIHFYLWTAISLVLFPMVAVGLSYLIFVPLVRSVPWLRNRNRLVTIGGILGIGAAVGMQFIIQVGSIEDPVHMVQVVSDQGDLALAMSRFLPPVAWLSNALGGDWAQGLLLLVGASGFAFILILAVSGWYRSSLFGFGEEKLERMGDASSFLTEKLRSRGMLGEYFIREWNMMNREPSFFLNGPLVVFLLPVILIAALLAQGDQIVLLVDQLRHSGGNFVPLVVAGIGIFIGSPSNIAPTAFSREGAQMWYLKAMPSDWKNLIRAKLAHAMVFSAIGGIWAVPLGVYLGVEVPVLVLVYLVILCYSFMANGLSLGFDLLDPRLHWEKPVVAMKQNPNALVGVLGSFLILGISGFISSQLEIDTVVQLAGFAVSYATLGLVMYTLLMVRGPRRLERLEP